MSFDWRALSAEQMEQHFNPRRAVPDAQTHIDRYIANSAQARSEVSGTYDVRYGDGDKQCLDVHAAVGVDGNAPLVLFIHGGFWRGLDKNDHSFIAPPVVNSGAVLANINYDLCPGVTLDVIVEQIAQAVLFCHANAPQWGADPQRLYLFGHSAGAHLAAEMLLRDWSQTASIKRAIRAVAAITGVYEPQVILGLSVNEEARISAEVAAARSCLDKEFHLSPEILIAAGGDEPEGWIAQSESFAAACIRARLNTQMQIVPGSNHFTVLERAVLEGDPLQQALFALWRQG